MINNFNEFNEWARNWAPSLKVLGVVGTIGFAGYWGISNFLGWQSNIEQKVVSLDHSIERVHSDVDDLTRDFREFRVEMNNRISKIDVHLIKIFQSLPRQINSAE